MCTLDEINMKVNAAELIRNGAGGETPVWGQKEVLKLQI